MQTATNKTVSTMITGRVRYKREMVSLSIAGLKKSSTEPVGLKMQVLGHGI